MTAPRRPLPPEEEQAPDPAFNLRRGLIAVVIIITVMAIVTSLCVLLARPG